LLASRPDAEFIVRELARLLEDLSGPEAANR
jgi:hypothetical protein